MKKVAVFLLVFFCVVSVYAKPIIEFDGTDWTTWDPAARGYFLLGFVHAIESMGFSLSWAQLDAFLADVDAYYEETKEYARPIWAVIYLLEQRNRGQSDELEGEAG